MIRKTCWPILGVIALGLLFGCSGDGDNGTNPPPPVPPVRLVAKLHQDPGLGSVDNAVWDSITAATVPIGTSNSYNANVGFRNDLTVAMKALVTGSAFYLRAEWNDNSEDNRFGELQARWLNNKVNWELVDTTLFRNEDRFSIIFDAGGPAGADCASLCHSTANASGFRFYGAAGDNADLWQWKAHRTGLAGFAEDMHMTVDRVTPDPQAELADSLYFRNFDEFFGRPLYMHPDTTAYTGPALLESEYVLFEAADNYLSWAGPDDSVGLTMPGYYLNQISGSQGSRWNVQTISAHNGTKWSLVMKRSLITADADDIPLSLTAPDSMAIAVAVCFNSGIKHYGRSPFYLVFE